MKYKIITIPVVSPEEKNRELNSFLSTHKIIQVEKATIQDSGHAFWTFSIEYIESEKYPKQQVKTKIDYREVLSAEDFAVYSRLRELRKEMAFREGVPVYALFTNEQLAKVVTGKITTKATLQKIEGIGQNKVEKYGNEILQFMKELII